MKRYVVIDKKGDFCFEGTILDLREYVNETVETCCVTMRSSEDFFKEFTVYETTGKLLGLEGLKL